jgi:putative endonuclease
VDRGAYWEGAVTTFLQAKGYHLLERNFRGPHGEIDIITEQAGRIVFIEVKARRSAAYGMPYEAVTPKKQKAIIATAEVFLYQRGWSDQKEVRYDIISVLYPKNAAPQITHIEDAFRVEDPLD